MIKKYYIISFHIIILCFLLFNKCQAQTSNYIAIIPPFHSWDNSGNTESPLQLNQQRFVLFVYPNAVAVYSESEFINPGDSYIRQVIALPSTGHNENENSPNSRISNGILSIQLWIANERVNPEFIREGKEEWFTLETKFASEQVRTVKALFWAQTSFDNVDAIEGMDSAKIKAGKRGFLINLSHAAVWNSTIQSINVRLVLMDGILPDTATFSVEPFGYNLMDSTLTWMFEDIEPTSDNNIFFSYDSGKNNDPNQYNMDNLANFITRDVYEQLVNYAIQLEESGNF